MLVVTGSLQVGALVTRIAGRKHAGSPARHGRSQRGAGACVDPVWFLGRPAQGECRIWGAASGRGRCGSHWTSKAERIRLVFWPVWLWNFVMVYALVYLKFFFRVYF